MEIKDEKFVYILSEAPINNTFDHHWKMILQENVKIIVILVDLKPYKKTLKNKYWPDVDQSIDLLECYQITTLKEWEEYGIDHVNLIVTNKNDKSYTSISIQYYNEWLDRDIPNDLDIIIKLVDNIYMKRETKTTSPVLIHCSDGAGRSGTFVLIDMMINKIRLEGWFTLISIKINLILVRSLRPYLVDTLDQYKFIYTTIKHYIELKFKDLYFQSVYPD
ncbi:hypothetical protein HZS_3030 [Henneguya salminicola]|nr:hypothetical protein HZS_3030 [Henneguya salminicola]